MIDTMFVALLLALAIGWWLGRYGLPRFSHPWIRPRSQQYLKGFTYLINEQSDAAVDSFLAQLDVNPKTLEMHIAIGTMLRRKGELDRAIRVHQNLLESRSLNASELSLAQLELARDFYSAGILDRVEGILCDMINGGTRYKEEALHLLLDVYRDLQQWQDALDTANTLRKVSPSAAAIKGLSEAMGHYCCQLAEESLEKDNTNEAERHIANALSYDPGCARATILAASIAVGVEGEAVAKRALYKVADQDVSLFSEAVKVLERLPVDETSLHVVQQAHQRYPSQSAFLYLYQATDTLQGEAASQQLLLDEVSTHPSLTALDTYLARQPVEKTNAEVRGVVRHTLQSILSRRDRYLCRHCGFRGSQLHWLCPKCKRWGEIRQRYGL